MSDVPVEWSNLAGVLDEFVRGIRAELQARWKAWDIDLTKPALHEVVGGLMARQVTLASQLASAPQVWNGHIAPLILRTMTDVYITLAWILEDPEPRSDRYVKYGLGQKKLSLEHFKASLVERGEKDVENHPIVKVQTERLNVERFEHITEVDVGSWSELSTREMAEEAGCLDLYRLAYTPFSAAVHNMWGHLADYNLERCRSPLHQFHRVPSEARSDPDIDYVYRASKYLAKTFRLFDRKTGVSVAVSSSFDLFVKAVVALGGTPVQERADEPYGL